MRVELGNVSIEVQGCRILTGLNLTLKPGELVGVIGPSGSGVSLLLKTAAGLMPAAGGEVRHDGIDLSALGEEAGRLLQTRSGFMFQDAALWANTSLEGNLLLPLRAKFPHIRTHDLLERLRSGVEEAGLVCDLSLRPAQLSFGQKRFLSFLRASLPDPQALFLDEPMNGLDADWADGLWRRTSALRAAGTSILAGSHHFQSWCDQADRILVLRDGRVVLEGTPQEVRETSPEVMS